jgi:hypothetical protein
LTFSASTSVATANCANSVSNYRLAKCHIGVRDGSQEFTPAGSFGVRSPAPRLSEALSAFAVYAKRPALLTTRQQAAVSVVGTELEIAFKLPSVNPDPTFSSPRIVRDRHRAEPAHALGRPTHAPPRVCGNIAARWCSRSPQRKPFLGRRAHAIVGSGLTSTKMRRFLMLRRRIPDPASRTQIQTALSRSKDTPLDLERYHPCPPYKHQADWSIARSQAAHRRRH